MPELDTTPTQRNYLELQKRISEERGIQTSKERHRQAWVRGLHARGRTPKATILHVDDKEEP